jgi:uncharacterized membrane protein
MDNFDQRLEPQHYKLGIFYFNPKDDRIIVRRRSGAASWLSWTLNFARPQAYFILFLFIAVIIFKNLYKPS